MRCHPILKEEDRAYFEQKAKNLKRQKLDATGAIYGETKELDSSIIQSCLLGSLKEKATYSFRGTNFTMYQRNCTFVIGKNETFPLFSIELDETTDASLNAQLLYFETTTTAYDVIDLISAYFMRHELSWSNLVGVLTDGPPAMLGSRSWAPQATCIHRFVYREALASKSLPAKLDVLFKKIVKVVSYVKGTEKNTHLFEQLCADMSSIRETALRNERKAFLQEQKKRDLLEVYSIKYFEA
ncbi:Zinc finger BED domain-containing protein 5 [Trichinella spiralis]|uniref:Zinc finger BED domain-containing protein 5 n=1 Tax=Trichinella spiralis TaxID=6334 RepID=A0A0V1AQD4_TRISP|nr:Zinc finger BED domain-containing protein 5 [Trichinella spiralis]